MSASEQLKQVEEELQNLRGGMTWGADKWGNGAEQGRILELEKRHAELAKQVEIESLESALAELTNNPNKTQMEENRMRAIEGRLSDLKNSAEQETVRKQQQEQQVGGLVDTAKEIFEALFPENIYSRKLGLTEYEEKRQDFNKAFHAASSDYVSAISGPHAAELAKRDEQNKTLFDQLMSAEQETSEIKGQLHASVEQNTKLLTENETLNSQLEQTKSEFAAAQEEVKRLNGHVYDLQVKLANAPAPRPAIDITPTNGNLASVLGGIREKQKKEYTPEELAALGLGPRGVIMTVGAKNDIPKAVSPFPAQVDPQSVEQSTDAIPPVIPVTDEQFRKADAVETTADTTMDGKAGAETSLDGLAQKVAELEARVTQLEQNRTAVWS